jgi:hypothetical protein
MNRLFLALTLFALLVAACANPAAQAPTATPAPSPTDVPPTPISENDLLARGAAMDALAKALGAPMNQITFVSLEEVEWPDSCLGIVYIDALCAAVVTPGYRIVLEADGTQYVYHTDADGTTALAAKTDGLGVDDALQRAAREALARALGIEFTSIVVVSAEQVEWPDSCLGVARPGLACLEVITPGVSLTLKANGMSYDYHTNADGGVILPATTALTWHREGGIAGFCDDLVIYLAGEVHASSCAGAATSGQLTPDELAQLRQWLTTFGPLSLSHKDPAVADAMTILLTLNGAGSEIAAEADRQTLMAWAQAVYARVTTAAVEG